MRTFRCEQIFNVTLVHVSVATYATSDDDATEYTLHTFYARQHELIRVYILKVYSTYTNYIMYVHLIIQFDIFFFFLHRTAAIV